jgi:hypothetical protein
MVKLKVLRETVEDVCSLFGTCKVNIITFLFSENKTFLNKLPPVD